MLRILTFCIAVIMTGVTPASEVSEDAALLIRVQGRVQIQMTGAAPMPAKPMIRVAAGDQLQLSGQSSVQMVFYKTGIQETWSGVGSLTVESTQGKSETLKVTKRELPALMAVQLLKIPDSAQHSKAGMVRLRSLKDIEKILEIETRYTEYRDASEAGDMTPELYFISGMLELKQYDRIREFLAELDQKHPDSPVYQEMITHFESLVTPDRTTGSE